MMGAGSHQHRRGEHRRFTVRQHCDLVGDVGQRRRDALRAARLEATGANTGVDPDSWEPALGSCAYGPGCLALALAGTVDRAGLERLHALGRELDHLAHTELVVDCSALTSCSPILARALARLRVQGLAAGATVELHHPPEALAGELGAAPE